MKRSDSRKLDSRRTARIYNEEVALATNEDVPAADAENPFGSPMYPQQTNQQSSQSSAATGPYPTRKKADGSSSKVNAHGSRRQETADEESPRDNPGKRIQKPPLPSGQKTQQRVSVSNRVKSNAREAENVAQKDELLIYDLVGFGQPANLSTERERKQSSTSSSRHQIQMANLTNNEESDNSMSFSQDLPTVDTILYKVIEQTIVAYSCETKLRPEEILKMLDPVELQDYKEEVIVPLLKQPNVIIEQTILNAGQYPLTPWLDATIYFVSQMDEIQKGSHFLEGMYELQQTSTGQTIKIFAQNFDAPDDSEKVFVARFSDCSSQLEVSTYDIEDSEMLKNMGIAEDDLNGIMSLINSKINPYRRRLVLQIKIIMSYIVGGVLLLSVFATLLGIAISYWISLVLVIVYFIGLFVIQKVTSKRTQQMEKTVLFNLALILTNINKNILEPKFRIRARIGHLAQWIEFHALPRKVNRFFSTLQPGANLGSPGENQLLRRSFVSSDVKAKTLSSSKKRTPELGTSPISSIGDKSKLTSQKCYDDEFDLTNNTVANVQKAVNRNAVMNYPGRSATEADEKVKDSDDVVQVGEDLNESSSPDERESQLSDYH